MQENNKPVTLQDIADIFGCSKNTVSQALRGVGRMSEETRRKITQMAKETGYIPNIAAKNLATNKSGMIGIYTHALYDAVRVELVNGLIAKLHTTEYRPVLALDPQHKGYWFESSWMRSFQALNVEAIVLVSELVGNLPTWCMNIPIILLAVQPNKQINFDSLNLDRKEAAEKAFDYLLKQDHDNFILCSSHGNPFTERSIEIIKENNLNNKIYNYDIFSGDLLKEILNDFKSSKNKPSAGVFGDSNVAANFINTALNAGIKIPSDLAVIAYDYFPSADLLKVPLSIVEQPIDKLASEAVKMVRNRIMNPDSPVNTKTLKHKLVMRDSC